METLTIIQDSYGNYIGRITRKEKILSVGNNYYLEIQRQGRNKIKRIKIGADGNYFGIDVLMREISINSLEFNKKGIEVKVKESGSPEKTFLISRNRFPN